MRPHLNGGGLTFGQDYVEFLNTSLPPRPSGLRHCAEVFAGPAFIGFSLLAHGICTRLTLVDINPEAIALLRTTVDDSGLHGIVEIVHADVLTPLDAGSGFGEMKWDLVVSNPPHCDLASATAGPRRGTLSGRDLLLNDAGFDMHRRLYAELPSFLSPGADVIIQENHRCSNASDFLRFVPPELVFIKTSPPTDRRVAPFYSYMWTRYIPGNRAGKFVNQILNTYFK
jgi:methylase of polypeptide subunit release factors